MSGIFGAEELSAYVTRTIATTDIDAPGGIVASLNICNKSNVAAYITVAVTTELDNFDSASQYIEYETVLAPKEVLERTSITVQAGRYITVMSSIDNVNCTAWGITNGRFVTAPDPFAPTEVSFIANGGEANLRMGRATTDIGDATYALTAGTMPTNLVLQSNGTVTGITPTTGYVSGGEVSAVTVEATVDSVVTPKSFNITKLWLDGSTPRQAAASGYAINQLDIGNFSDGTYWITNPNINQGIPLQVYCDMTTDNGGWTLLITVRADTVGQMGWNYQNIGLRNEDNPQLVDAYSILSYGDYIKKSASGWQWMVEAANDSSTRATSGGIFTANGNYLVAGHTPNQTDITANTWFAPAAAFVENEGIGPRVPWIGEASESGATALFTTHPGTGSWWGTIVQTDANYDSYKTGPWISSDDPEPLWKHFWIR